MLRRIKYKGTAIEYELRQTNRRSVECRVEPGRVTVFAPFSYPVSAADEFVLRQGDWILNTLRQAGQRAEAKLERDVQSMQDGSLIPIEGKEYALMCLPGSQTVVKTDKDRLVVFGAPKDPLKVREAVRGYLVRLALVRFEERVKYFAPLVGVHPKKVTLREQKTKWGSCSSLGNLNFNWKLIMAPPKALDSVVVHELCHMIELNHSPAFWALVRKHMPDYDIWHNYLKQGIKGPF